MCPSYLALCVAALVPIGEGTAATVGVGSGLGDGHIGHAGRSASGESLLLPPVLSNESPLLLPAPGDGEPETVGVAVGASGFGLEGSHASAVDPEKKLPTTPAKASAIEQTWPSLPVPTLPLSAQR